MYNILTVYWGVFMDIIDVKKGDKKIKSKFVLENQGLVKSIAVKYNAENKYDIDDLISEGNIGLMRAIDMYNPEFGFKFSTYATYWIKKMIQEYIRYESKSVYITCHGYNRLSKYHKALMELTNKLDREPTLEEISKYTHIPVDELNYLISSEYKYPSIDAIHEINDNVVVKSIYDNAYDDPIKIYEENELMYEIRNVILNSDLTETQMKVLILRYGLYGAERKTMEEVGKILGVSRQRVNQYEVQALKKIRNSKFFRKLEGYGKIYNKR